MIKRIKKESIPDQFRQGDVFLIAADKPANAVCQPRADRLVLEHGEATGHAHAIEKTDSVELFVDGGRRYLQVRQEVALTHEEHAPVHLPKKIFEVRRQRTWSVLKQASERVLD